MGASPPHPHTAHFVLWGVRPDAQGCTLHVGALLPSRGTAHLFGGLRPRPRAGHTAVLLMWGLHPHIRSVPTTEWALRRQTYMLLAVSAVLLAADCTGSTSSAGSKGAANDDLVGAWRGRVQFKNGEFATLKDLEFMYVFNAGGTMTESSNFDAAPPVPPAYGVWRRTGPRQFLARYEFLLDQASQNL